VIEKELEFRGKLCRFNMTRIMVYIHCIILLTPSTVSNIRVEALQSLGPIDYNEDKTISLIPEDFGLTEWADETIGHK